jgi:hypothetical protein
MIHVTVARGTLSTHKFNIIHHEMAILPQLLLMSRLRGAAVSKDLILRFRIMTWGSDIRMRSYKPSGCVAGDVADKITHC